MFTSYLEFVWDSKEIHFVFTLINSHHLEMELEKLFIERKVHTSVLNFSTRVSWNGVQTVRVCLATTYP